MVKARIGVVAGLLAGATAVIVVLAWPRSNDPCLPAALRATAGFQGATQSMLGGLSITNTSAHACALPPTPKVSLVWHGRTLAVQQVAFPQGWLSSQYPWGTSRVHRLEPGQRAFVVLQW